MRIVSFFAIGSGLLLCSCTQYLSNWGSSNKNSDPIAQSLRIEVSDLKHNLSALQIELQMVDEKLRVHEEALSSVRSLVLAMQTQEKDLYRQEFEDVRGKLAMLDRGFEKMRGDIKGLSTQAHTLFHQSIKEIDDFKEVISEQKIKIDEMTHIKGRINSLLDSMSQGASNYQTYKVKSGDTLGKIADEFQLPIKVLKEINQIKDDKIFVGAELKIPLNNSNVQSTPSQR